MSSGSFSSTSSLPNYRAARAVLISQCNNVALELRQLHEQGHSKRFEMVPTISAVVKCLEMISVDGSFADNLLATDVPMTVFNIACDSSTYDHVEYTSKVLVRQITLYFC